MLNNGFAVPIRTGRWYQMRMVLPVHPASPSGEPAQ